MVLLEVIVLFFIFCVCAFTHVTQCVSVKVRDNFLDSEFSPSTMQIQGSNSDHQAPLPTEPTW